MMGLDEEIDGMAADCNAGEGGHSGCIGQDNREVKRLSESV